MQTSKSSLPKEKLNDLLDSNRETSPSTGAEAPTIDRLIDNVLEISSPSAPPNPIAKRRKNRRMRRLGVPLLLSMAILGGIFMGTIFGYLWGSLPTREGGMDSKIESVLTELRKITYHLEGEKQECIEPILNPIEPESLAPASYSFSFTDYQ